MKTKVSELVKSSLAGDKDAFGQLVERFQGMVQGLAVGMLGNFAEAEDIAQETFIQAYRKLASLADPGKFPGWLRVIALNKIRQCLRQRRPEQTVDFGPGGKQPVNPQGQLDANHDLRLAVAAAVTALPEPQRDAITLYYMHGQSYAEGGRFLDVQPTTVKGRLAAGRKRLKREMMTMVEHVLENEKPGHEQAVRTLRRAAKAAQEARKRRDYAKLRETSDQALAALEQLPETPKRLGTKVDALKWAAMAAEFSDQDMDTALRRYGDALETALKLGDPEKAYAAVWHGLRALLGAGEPKRLTQWANRCRKAGRQLNDERLLAFGTAAEDLARDPTYVQDTGDWSGLAVGRFHAIARNGYWCLDPPESMPGGSTNWPARILTGGSSGWPWISLLYLLRGPEAMIPIEPRVGHRWSGESFNRWAHSLHVRGSTDVKMQAESVIETKTGGVYGLANPQRKPVCTALAI